MKTMILTTILIIFMVTMAPAVLVLGIRNTPDRYQPSLDRVQQIYENVTLSQTFISTDENLSMIGFSIKNPNLENKKDISLSINDSNNNFLAVSILNGKSIPDGDFVKFKFLPIKDSKDKLLTFTLSAPSSSKLDSLEVFLTKQEVFGVSDLKIVPIQIDQEEASMSVSFVPFYRVSSPIAQILEIYFDWGMRFFADRAFAISYILLITLTIILLAKFPLNRLKK